MGRLEDAIAADGGLAGVLEQELRAVERELDRDVPEAGGVLVQCDHEAELVVVGPRHLRHAREPAGRIVPAEEAPADQGTDLLEPGEADTPA